jgi:hypothetical protein
MAKRDDSHDWLFDLVLLPVLLIGGAVKTLKWLVK